MIIDPDEVTASAAIITMLTAQRNGLVRESRARYAEMSARQRELAMIVLLAWFDGAVEAMAHALGRDGAVDELVADLGISIQTGSYFDDID